MTHPATFIDLTGEQFGDVKVLEFFGRVRRTSVWVCRCLCGRVFNETTNHLRKGDVHRCNACRVRLLPFKSRLMHSERRMKARKRVK